MSPGTDRTRRDLRLVIGGVATGAALVLGTWLALRPAAPAPAPASAPAAQARVGVAPAEVDPARRLPVFDMPDEPRIAAAPPVPRLELSPERRRALEEPVPQTPRDPVLTAAVAAREAAIPSATAELEAALADRQAAVARACWKGGADGAQVFFQAQFDAAGKLTGHQVADNGQAPAGLTECVGRQPFAMKIPAPGADLTVRAAMTFP
jgi:hypothetical protein